MALARRLTREDWISLARKVLIKSGIDDVKVDRLAKRMKVTRGSFYWHFQDREALLDALLDDWRGRNIREIEQITARWAVTPLDFAEVVKIWLGEDPLVPQFDMAIRAWSKKSARVARLVQETDDAWLGLLQSHFLRAGCSADESLVRARVVYFHQIGYYAVAIVEDFETRARLVPFYYEVLTGRSAAPELKTMLSSMTASAANKSGRRKSEGETADKPAKRAASKDALPTASKRAVRR